jgi:nicotinamide-nucleotide amidase
LTGAGPPGAALPSTGRAGPAEPGGAELAARIVGLLTRRRQTVAVAESLTGGLLGAAITTVPGASVVFRGGVIAYATDLKAALLGVPAELLAERGAVDPDVAGAMAAGVARRLGATAGMATTGVAGPDPADGKPPGTVHIAVCAGGGAVVQTLALSGSRDEIRRGTVERSLRLLWSVLGEESL